jgi:hypothetical protein
MSELRTERINSAKFTYDAFTMVFSAFMSDLRCEFVPIYDDACDYGFTMVSARTGKEANFFMVGPIMKNDEMVGWELRPTDAAIKQQPRLRGAKVEIWNT